MSLHVSCEHAVLISSSEDITLFCKISIGKYFFLHSTGLLTDVPQLINSFCPKSLLIEYTDPDIFSILKNLSKTCSFPSLFFIVRHSCLAEFMQQCKMEFSGVIPFPSSCKILQKMLFPLLSTSTVNNDYKIRHINENITEISGFERLLGRSTAIFTVKKQLAKVAENKIPVLLLGESGTGKSLAAELLHQNSKRSGRKFCTINMAAVPENLADSELFGTVAGAYTGAINRRGYFAEADGGTLFLDEIGELQLSIQAKLLRVLENGVYRSIGSDIEKFADVRLIFATNKDLHTQMKLKEFRSDLYYRIADFPIVFPPLRERPEDISLLIESFLSTRQKILSKAALHKIMTYSWPGNIRQLKSCIRRACIMCRDDVINIEDIIFDY